MVDSLSSEELGILKSVAYESTYYLMRMCIGVSNVTAKDMDMVSRLLRKDIKTESQLYEALSGIRWGLVKGLAQQGEFFYASRGDSLTPQMLLEVLQSADNAQRQRDFVCTSDAQIVTRILTYISADKSEYYQEAVDCIFDGKDLLADHELVEQLVAIYGDFKRGKNIPKALTEVIDLENMTTNIFIPFIVDSLIDYYKILHKDSLTCPDAGKCDKMPVTGVFCNIMSD